MSFLFNLPGPHDVPFAAPLMVAAMLGFVIGFTILRLLDHWLPQDANMPKNSDGGD